MFSRTVHVVTHPDYAFELYIDFNALKTQHSGYNKTLAEWFVEIDNLTLPRLETLPSTRIRYISYSDAHQAGYKISVETAGEFTPDNFPREMSPDAKLIRPRTDTDVTRLHNRALVTVNGYLHLTDTDNEHLWVLDAAKSMRHANMNHLGIISFDRVCSLKKLPITSDMIYPEVPDRPLREHLSIVLDEDIGNRSVLVSVGGYLQLIEPGVCWQSGERAITICIDRLPHRERYQESRQYLNLASLELTLDPNNPSVVISNELYSDAVLKRYLQLRQSFVVLLDIPNLFYRKIHIRHSSLPGMYVSHQDPTYPQITGYGKISEYWKVYEDDQWAVNIVDGIQNNYVSSYRPMHDLEILNDHRLPGRSYRHSTGYLLEMGGY